MKLATLPALQVACCILLLASPVLAGPKIKSSKNDHDKDIEKFADDEVPKNHRKQLEDEIDLDDLFDAEKIKNEQLPILPPLILLDFVNGTDDNSTLDGEEKSKRTIDGSLGYGFDRNNFFSGNHNFYLPGGKGATSVSIEESISPFEPKTVTEIEKPIMEESDAEIAQEEQKSRKTLFEKMPQPLPLQNGREPLPQYPPFASFGQRTKLYKTSSSEFGQQQQQRPQMKYTSSFSATPGSDIYNKLLTTYTSIKPTGNQVSPTTYSNSANIQSYVRPMTSSYIANYMADTYNPGSGQKSPYNLQSSSLSSETPINPQDIPNYPRYTVENGIKYEHKIVWKYPDGRVSEMAPTSYMNLYSDHSNSANIGSFRPSSSYQTLPTKSQQSISPGSMAYNQYTSAAHANIFSQKPIQFPTDQEQPGNSEQKPATGFVSSATMNISPIRQNSAISSYNLQNYQGQFGLRQYPKVNNYRPSPNHNDQYSAYSNNYRPASSYSSSSSEYSYPGGSHSTENLFTSSGHLNKNILAKYTPQAQEYLSKVFANGKAPTKSEYQNDDSKNYANTDYSSLLNYNPSISQYIKNPASILKAQPTFIQAGDSLIPVIILRVDGTPPVQPHKSSNINLKSLLRQYLTHYADTVSKVTPNINYNLASTVESAPSTDYRVGISAPPSNPVQDLKELTETLASLRQRGYQDPDFANNLTPEYSQPPQSAHPPTSEIVHDYTSSNYNAFYQRSSSEQQVKKPMKVKNIQIIEDPRYTSYKTDNEKIM